jgi:CubicO group peptidase (beta-lactamase class C family)
MKSRLLPVLVLLSFPALPIAQAPDPARRVDAGAVARFADSFLPGEMARRQIPGLVLAVVADGRLAAARGYGAAQLDPWRAADPASTIFRVASVSKLVTATAVMQLAEQGRLDLHRDVNAYLRGFRVPSRHGVITLHHLLTHTAGFDDRLTGIFARPVSEQEPLRAYLARTMPPTFIEPGRMISYSNHGVALAGLIVEETSGRPFADYVRECILEPLGMRSSGFTLPPDVQRRRALAYERDGTTLRELPFDAVRTTPAGTFATTATDMSRFLIAHLRGGAFEGRRILASETTALMHAPHFRQHPDVSGWAYGFWEDRSAPGGALLHNGGGTGYRALAYLLPAYDFGFFLAYNLADRDASGELQEVFVRKLLELFVPAPPRSSTAYAGDIPSKLAGTYRYVRRARTTGEKFIGFFNTIRIDRDRSGVLTLTRRPEAPVRLTPIGRTLFRTNDGKGQVAFDLTPDGTPRWLVLDAGFPAVYDRAALVETLPVQAAWLGSMAAIFLYACRDARRRSRWLTGAAAALNLIFLVGFPLAFIGHITGGMPAFAFGVPPVARVLLVIPPLTTALTLAAAVAFVRAARRPHSNLELTRNAVIVIALMGFVAFAACWQVLDGGF